MKQEQKMYFHKNCEKCGKKFRPTGRCSSLCYHCLPQRSKRIYFGKVMKLLIKAEKASGYPVYELIEPILKEGCKF